MLPCSGGTNNFSSCLLAAEISEILIFSSVDRDMQSSPSGNHLKIIMSTPGG